MLWFVLSALLNIPTTVYQFCVIERFKWMSALESFWKTISDASRKFITLRPFKDRWPERSLFNLSSTVYRFYAKYPFLWIYKILTSSADSWYTVSHRCEICYKTRACWQKGNLLLVICCAQGLTVNDSDRLDNGKWNWNDP